MSLTLALAGLWLAAGSVPASAAATLSDSEVRFVMAELSQPRPGVVLDAPSPEDLLRDHALWSVRRMRSELNESGELSPELLREAKHLQRERYALLEKNDRALLDGVLALRLGGFSVSALSIKASWPAPVALPAQVLAEPDFPAFLEAVRADAAAQGVPKAVLDEALNGLSVDQQVLAAENSTPEHTITLEQYLTAVVSEKRVSNGRLQLGSNAELLDRVSAAYHLPVPMLVSIWGMESSYGLNQGTFQVVRSLATLGFAGKRPTFFRKELLAALRILADEHMASRDLKGSWAGAMGQPQFMPSSFRSLAVDFDGDGRRDIWKSPADVLASMANFLAKAGWDQSTGWGAEVVLPEAFEQSLTGLSILKPVSAWRALGVRPAAGAALPADGVQASVLRPSGPGGRAILAGPNFRVLMRYNNSTYYASAGGVLADRISAKAR